MINKEQYFFGKMVYLDFLFPEIIEKILYSLIPLFTERNSILINIQSNMFLYHFLVHFLCIATNKVHDIIRVFFGIDYAASHNAVKLCNQSRTHSFLYCNTPQRDG